MKIMIKKAWPYKLHIEAFVRVITYILKKILYIFPYHFPCILLVVSYNIFLFLHLLQMIDAEANLTLLNGPIFSNTLLINPYIDSFRP